MTIVLLSVIVIVLFSLGAADSATLYRFLPGQAVPASKLRFKLVPNSSRTDSHFPFRVSPSTANDWIIEPKTLLNLIAGKDRFTIKIVLDSRPNHELIASVDACSLLASGCNDTITLLCDSFGSVIFADYRVNETVVTGTSCSPSNVAHIQVHTNLDVFPIEEGPIPINLDTLYEVPDQPKEDPSIFRKYWYIFVPVGLMLVLTSLG